MVFFIESSSIIVIRLEVNVYRLNMGGIEL